jgi:orotidine-5'-phosphate decarboxylase
MKSIPTKDRLIVALDVDGIKEAKSLILKLGDSVSFYKLGLQLLMSSNYFDIVEQLQYMGKKVFADLKFFDVPQTVGLAIKSLSEYDIDFATIHGNDEMLRYANKEKGNTKILAVSALTSLDQADINSLGFQCSVEELVFSRSKRALDIGCDGVISSGLEVSMLRKHLGDKFLVVVPGIRPVENKLIDDQKRTIDIEEAFLNGADYIVVGRPIKNSNDPYATAMEYQERIAKIIK